MVWHTLPPASRDWFDCPGDLASLSRELPKAETSLASIARSEWNKSAMPSRRLTLQDSHSPVMGVTVMRVRRTVSLALLVIE